MENFKYWKRSLSSQKGDYFKLIFNQTFLLQYLLVQWLLIMELEGFDETTT